MQKSKRLFLLSLAIGVGAGSFFHAVAQSGDDLVTLCYKGKTIQVPFYLKARYMAAPYNAVPGPCPTS